MKKLLIVLIGMMMLTTTACSTFKVTDPANPKFNPDKFQFEDYRGIPQMTDALKKLFPVGTPKEFVERVLVQEGGALVKSRLAPDGANVYNKKPNYLFPSFPNRVWNVSVKYDENDTVKLLRLNGSNVFDSH